VVKLVLKQVMARVSKFWFVWLTHMMVGHVLATYILVT